MKTRNTKLDAIKMALIIFVVLGHVPLLSGFLNLGLPESYDTLTQHTMKGIYAFHMPLFVMLSGYFSRKKTLKEQFTGSLKLLRLYFIFQFINLFIQYIATNKVPSFHQCLIPSFALWYLLDLFYWRMLLSTLPHNLNPKFIIAITLIISIMVGFIPIGAELGLHRFFSFMPYFMIGHYYGEKFIQYINNKSFTKKSKLIITTLFFIVLIIVSFNPHWLNAIIQSYNKQTGSIIRIAFISYSILLSILFIIIFSFKQSWDKNILSHLGQDTLFFYLLHPYVLYSLIRIWSSIKTDINFIDTITITTITIAFLYLLNRTKIIRL